MKVSSNSSFSTSTKGSGYWAKRKALSEIARKRGYDGRYAYMATRGLVGRRGAA